jgi:hypothetical protein
LRPECCRILIAPDGDDEIDVLLTKTRDDGSKHAGSAVENGTEARVNGGTRGQTRKPNG